MSHSHVSRMVFHTVEVKNSPRDHGYLFLPLVVGEGVEGEEEEEEEEATRFVHAEVTAVCFTAVL